MNLTRVERTKERIHELEDKAIEITQLNQQREHRLKKKMKTLAIGGTIAKNEKN